MSCYKMYASMTLDWSNKNNIMFLIVGEAPILFVCVHTHTLMIIPAQDNDKAQSMHRLQNCFPQPRSINHDHLQKTFPELDLSWGERDLAVVQ